MENSYYVYIISNENHTVLYVGMTNNLQRRMWEHKYGLVEGFSKDYNLQKLVWYEETNDVMSAIEEEKRLKNWHREWKNELVEKDNPEWEDLSKGWFENTENPENY